MQRNQFQVTNSSPPLTSTPAPSASTARRLLRPREGREQAPKRVHSGCELNER